MVSSPGNDIIISNSLTHVVIYGYFQHAYEVYIGSLGEGVKELTVQDKVLQQQLFRSLRYKLRGQSINKPNAINGIAALFGAKKNYPIYIDLSPQERFWFDYIMKMNIGQMKKNYKKFLKLTGQKQPANAFKELINNVRTEKAADYLVRKFRNEVLITG